MFILCKPAAPDLVEYAEFVLCGGISLPRREPVKPYGFLLVFGKSTAAELVEGTKIELC